MLNLLLHVLAACASPSAYHQRHDNHHMNVAEYPAKVLSVSYAQTSANRLQVMEGFGVSLCWWAVGVGGWSNKTAFGEVMDLFFDKEGGLGLNQVRYNIGGGSPDDTSKETYRAGGSVEAFQPSADTWDWSADATQRRVLTAAKARGVQYVQAFANSPPSWMTVSGTATGSANGTTDNLRADHFDAFAEYLGQVAHHFKTEWGITFDSVAPLNEAAGGWWQAGNQQEGCHFDAESESKITLLLGKVLARLGVHGCGVSGPEENSIDASISTLVRQRASALEVWYLQIDLPVSASSYAAHQFAELNYFPLSSVRFLPISLLPPCFIGRISTYAGCISPRLNVHITFWFTRPATHQTMLHPILPLAHFVLLAAPSHAPTRAAGIVGRRSD